MGIGELIEKESGSSSFARNLRLLRIWRELEREELASASGLDPATISRLEHGHNKPRQGTLEKLAEALGVSPETLGG